MDDQFNVRTDDDLFLDDFEPVESEAVPLDVAPSLPTPTETSPSASQTRPTTAEARPPNPTPKKAASSSSSKPPPTSAGSHEPRPRGQLGQSRHAPPASSPNPRGGRGQRGRGGAGIGKPHVHAVQQANKPDITEGSGPAVASEDDAKQPTDAPAPTAADLGANAPPPNAPTGPAAAAAAGVATPQQTPVKPASVTSEARLKSGANPRTKLTDEELSAKMAAMAVASAEKMRRHNQAQRDERDHDMAMARSAEDARKRRAAEQEKRRQAEEDRRKLEDERARNRERKLKAMGGKDGAWEQEAQQEDRRAFTGGANGGIRGSKGLHSGRLGGLQSSKHAAGEGDEKNSDDHGHHNHRGGRGGGRGRGRGGDFGGGNGGGRSGPQASKPAINNEAEFPPLSTKPVPKPAAVETVKQTDNPVKMFSPLSPSARWDDEVEAEDARAKAADQSAA